MAVVFSDGFESNDFSVWANDTSGTIATSNLQAREGTISARVNLASSGTGFVRDAIYGSNQTGSNFARVYVRVHTAPSTTIQLIRFSNASNAHVGSIRLTSSLTLTLNQAGNSTIGSASSALSLDTWYCIELKITAPSNPGTLEGRLDGSVFATGSNSAQGNFSKLLIGNISPSATCDIYFDSVVVDDAAYPGLIVTGPNAPTSMTAVETASKAVLGWTDNSSDETNFVVERKRGNSSNYYVIATLGSNVVAYTDTSVAPGYTYTYRVKATNGSGSSTYATASDLTMSGTKAWTARIQAWIFPGQTSAQGELIDGRVLYAVKPEYGTVNGSGVYSEPTGSVNMIDDATMTPRARAYSAAPYFTVSAAAAGVAALTADSTLRTNCINGIVATLSSTEFAGVELDWEGFGTWSGTTYGNYKTFVTDLCTSVHAVGKKVIICGPPIGDSTEQSNYQWLYEDFESSTVDFVEPLAYDWDFDFGAGTAIAPTSRVRNVCAWTRSKISNANRIIIGMPSYGYFGTTAGFSITNITKVQAAARTGYPGTRDTPGSEEMMFANGGVSTVYNDTTGMNTKREIIEDEGIKYISVWHLGDNDWFSGKAELASPNPRLQTIVRQAVNRGSTY